MIVSVVSPTRRGGCSTVSALIASALASSLSIPVTLTHTGVKDMGMNLYLDLGRSYDITTNLDQLYTLIKQGALGEGSLQDYTISKTEYLNILEPITSCIDDNKATKILTYVMGTLDREIGVIDVSTELAEEATQEVLKKSNYIICVLDNSVLTFNKLKDWRSEVWGEFLKSKHVMYLFNNYNPNVTDLKRLSATIGVQHRDTWKLAYNPLIQKYCNNGELDLVVKHILAAYEPLINVGVDLDNIIDVIALQLGISSKQRRRLSNVK